MSLLLDKNNRCLGYLFNFTGKGVYSPDGKVDITPEQATAHNAALSQAEIDGLDQNCQVGQYGTFYYTENKVKTFVGEVVAEGNQIKINGKSITFTRKGKVYRGQFQKNADCFNFKRIK